MPYAKLKAPEHTVPKKEISAADKLSLLFFALIFVWLTWGIFLRG